MSDLVLKCVFIANLRRWKKEGIGKYIHIVLFEKSRVIYFTMWKESFVETQCFSTMWWDFAGGQAKVFSKDCTFFSRGKFFTHYVVWMKSTGNNPFETVVTSSLPYSFTLIFWTIPQHFNFLPIFIWNKCLGQVINVWKLQSVPFKVPFRLLFNLANVFV